MTREVYVIEEYDRETCQWFVVQTCLHRDHAERECAKWSKLPVHRVVAYGPTTGWHPIATAPKDGTPVLYWSATLGHIVGNHPDGCVAGGWVFRDGRWYGSEDAGAQAATHWMSLPEPPKEETPA